MDLNMTDLFGKMMEMRQKVTETQEALSQKTVTAEAGGGMVNVTAHGGMRITNIKIDPAAIDPDDVELLEDLIVAGINKALDEAAQMAQDEMGRAAGGLMPPGMDLGSLGL